MNESGNNDLKENLINDSNLFPDEFNESRESPTLNKHTINRNTNTQREEHSHFRNSSAQSLKPMYSVFLFVNPTSGGNKAADFTNLQTERIKFFSIDPKKDYETECFIYNLRDNVNRMRGFMTLKYELLKPETLSASNRYFRVIVCGGDGSVMWVVEEMIHYKIDPEKCPIGILPFGTGNDFSRVLGWGGDAPSDIIGKNLDSLKSLLLKWIDAEIQEFDIWNIEIETHDNGCFKTINRVNNQAQKQVVFDKKDSKLASKLFTKKMSNYFSIGIDARIGLGFEKHRTTNRCCNLMVYAWEGLKKMCIKTSRVNSVLENVEIMHEDNFIEEEMGHMDINIEDLVNKRDILFSTKSVFQEAEIPKPEKKPEENLEMNMNENQPLPKKGKKLPKIQGNPVSLLCLNINSYMGGGSDVWRECRGKVGVQKESITNFESQNFSDGKLEFLTFSSTMGMAKERIFKGQAKRVGQGAGPFQLNFKKSDNNDLPLITYFQIDGEYYEIVAPKVCRITSCNELRGGKIRVLVDKKNKT